MQRRNFLNVGAIAALSISSNVLAAEQKPLELFGMVLKGATRSQFRQVLKQNGLRAMREEDRFWVDQYDPQGVLDGATELQVGYASASNKFAFAEYKFDGSMDADLEAKVIRMVTSKYGSPSSQKGNPSPGPATARWDMGQMMEIVVWRDWPGANSYLRFQDIVFNALMLTEIEMEKKAQEGQKKKAQSNAF